jgi:hypothetical protein
MASSIILSFTGLQDYAHHLILRKDVFCMEFKMIDKIQKTNNLSK